ncbi:MAG: hypothetical protein J3K34DRAFT_94166 [Monoraphidium minutum]|nr:MAG: hypothetical protein J3K34DRAFT_94166 [Monoraphidium minutum]
MPRCGCCASPSAQLFCAQDASWFCDSCDSKAHCGPLTSNHCRVPACAVCASPAEVYCRNDAAYLCAGCNEECHAGLPLKHAIVPAAQAMKEGLAAAAPAAAAPAIEHSACGESSPAAPAAPPAAPRRISEDSAQRVPEFDAAVVPPGLDCELPKGVPLDRAALAKTIWGKDLDALDMDNTWLDRLDMGFDFADDMLADLAADALAPAPTTSDAAVPCLSLPGAAPGSPTAAQLDQQLSMAPAPRGAAAAALAAALIKPDAQREAAAALATLERQSTDEFFAALAGDFDAADAPPAHAADGLVPCMPPQQVPVFYAPQQVMYVPAGAAAPLVPTMAPAPPAAPAAATPRRAAPQQQGSAPKRQRRAAAAARRHGDDSDDEALTLSGAAGDDSDDDWRHEDEFGAPGAAAGRCARALAGAAAAPLAATAAGALPNPLVDNLTREQRVQRYREKRMRRQFKKTIRYASRKAYAEVRPRIKGRFAKKEELEAWRTAERAMAAGAAAAGVTLLPESAAAAASLACAFGGVEAPGVVPVM